MTGVELDDRWTDGLHRAAGQCRPQEMTPVELDTAGGKLEPVD